MERRGFRGVQKGLVRHKNCHNLLSHEHMDKDEEDEDEEKRERHVGGRRERKLKV